MGGCQNYGPFSGPYYNTGPDTGPNLRDPKREHNFDNPPNCCSDNEAKDTDNQRAIKLFWAACTTCVCSQLTYTKNKCDSAAIQSPKCSNTASVDVQGSVLTGASPCSCRYPSKKTYLNVHPPQPREPKTH